MHSIYPWQQQQWHQLINRMNSGNLPHAYLFSGPDGLGKFQFAYCFAELLLCKNSQPVACGECRSCQLLNAGNHPDLHLLKPEKVNTAIKIEQIRNIVQLVNNTAHQGGYQVVIIEPAENMNLAASNALLKTLEEPPGQVVIILLTEHPYRLAATIRSRCQQLIFNIPARNIAKQWLTTRRTDTFDLDLLLNLAAGAPIKALEFADSTKMEQREQLFEIFAALITNKITAMKFATMKTELELAEILVYLHSWLEDMIRFKSTCCRDARSCVSTNYDKAKTLQILAERYSTRRLFSLLDHLTEQVRYAANNLNPQLVLESIGFELQNLEISYVS